MNIAKFVVLGTLEKLDTASGYDILGFLEKKRVSRWTNLKTGSIYNALKSLEKSGEIQLVERIKNGLFPTATLYTITEQGQRSFDALQEEAFLGLFPLFFGFKLALKFNQRRTYAELCTFAQRAIERIDRFLQDMDDYLLAASATDAPHPDDAFFIEHDRMLLAAEKAWIQMVTGRLAPA